MEEWQLIDTAPKDEPILGAWIEDGQYKMPPHAIEWFKGHEFIPTPGWMVLGGKGFTIATHWARLPKLPKD